MKEVHFRRKALRADSELEFETHWLVFAFGFSTFYGYENLVRYLFGKVRGYCEVVAVQEFKRVAPHCFMRIALPCRHLLVLSSDSQTRRSGLKSCDHTV